MRHQNNLKLSLSLVILIFVKLVSFANSQSIPLSQYTRLNNYQSNQFFIVVNQTLQRAYPTYLSQSTVNSVYGYSSSSLLSIIINYNYRVGVIYRGTVDYTIQTKQLKIQSFGPVQSTTPSDNSGMTIYNESGIGIRLGTPPNQTDKLVPGTNPNITNQSISVLQNSTSVSTRNPSS